MDDSLSFGSFYEGARKAAWKAMEDHGRREYDEFALHAGVAIERLAKAVLVGRNPLYLVEMRNGNADLLLYFGGDLELDTNKVRTVGAGEALRRLRRMGILPPDPQLDLLIELRNGTAHTTIGNQAKVLLPTLTETIAVLLLDVGTNFHAFWGRWSSAVLLAIDKKRDEIQRDVEIRIDQAKHVFEDRFKGLSEDVKAQVLAAFEPHGPRFDLGLKARWLDELPVGGDYFHLATVDCPACEGPATVRFLPSENDTVRGSMDILYCDLCNLHLIGQDEVKASGATSPFQSSRPPRVLTITGVGPIPVRGPQPETGS
jgi:hypothetical protein